VAVIRFFNRARSVSVAAFAATCIVLSIGPALAEETPIAGPRTHEGAKRSTASLNANASAPGPGGAATTRPAAGFMNGFVYSAGPQSLGFRGRVNVGKSGVYVPYYGNVDVDPLHPAVQGVAGIGYGFRTWDVSVQNGPFSGSVPNVPGGATSKSNQSLSFSIRF
jgi:hypothetical protein